MTKCELCDKPIIPGVNSHALSGDYGTCKDCENALQADAKTVGTRWESRNEDLPDSFFNGGAPDPEDSCL